MNPAHIAICLAQRPLLPQRINGFFNGCGFAHFHGAGKPFDLLHNLGICDLDGHADVHMFIDNVVLYIRILKRVATRTIEFWTTVSKVA